MRCIDLLSRLPTTQGPTARSYEVHLRPGGSCGICTMPAAASYQVYIQPVHCEDFADCQPSSGPQLQGRTQYTFSRTGPAASNKARHSVVPSARSACASFGTCRLPTIARAPSLKVLCSKVMIFNPEDSVHCRILISLTVNISQHHNLTDSTTRFWRS